MAQNPIVERSQTPTRAEHLQWCKDRACEYLDNGDPHGAFQSFISDMSKHDGTRDHMGIGLIFAIDMNSCSEVRNWIEGFN